MSQHGNHTQETKSGSPVSGSRCDYLKSTSLRGNPKLREVDGSKRKNIMSSTTKLKRIELPDALDQKVVIRLASELHPELRVASDRLDGDCNSGLGRRCGTPLHIIEFVDDAQSRRAAEIREAGCACLQRGTRRECEIGKGESKYGRMHYDKDVERVDVLSDLKGETEGNE